jgi:asparagine synthase (glutamine-hydrolysing)
MSGLFVAAGNNQEIAEIAMQALSFAPNTWRKTADFAGLDIGVTRVDAPELWGPATDERVGLYVALGGRLAFEEAEWARAEELPHKGGLACRLVLDQWQQQRHEFELSLNGAGCVVIVDSKEKELHIITDRMGAFPLYVVEGEQILLCSHPDVLADAMKAYGQEVDIDWTSIAECLGMSSAVHPYTYYQQVKQLGAATHYCWKIESPYKRVEKVYWEPAYLREASQESAAKLTADLAEAFITAVRKRTNPRLGKTSVMLSGGADSRVALFAASEPSMVTSFTVFDEPNEELQTAKKLAATAGAAHIGLQRDFDYYADNAEEAVRISAGMWSFVDAHFLGFADAIKAHGAGTLLTGCYADYIFKGITANRKPRQLLSRNLPLYNLSQFCHVFYHGSTKLRESWQKKVVERLDARIPIELQASYPATAPQVDDLRLRPLSREVNASGRLILWRLFPWDLIFCDRDVLDIFARIPINFKLNGILFGQAVGQVIGKEGRKIPNNNYHSPVHATEAGRMFWFVMASLSRKAKRIISMKSSKSKLSTSGSWPEWSIFIAKSQKIGELFAEPSDRERETFEDIMGFDPWSMSQQEWGAKDPMLFMRFLTLRIWLKQRNAVKQFIPLDQLISETQN